MTSWSRVGRPLIALIAAAVISWFAFVASREVPLLDWFDLAVHEAGHLVAAFMPRMAMFMAGSIAQVAFPLGMALYFLLRRGDVAAGGFCMAWAGTAAWDVSVYAGDAVRQSLPLIGGGEHDWAYILGPQGFDALHMTDSVAGFIEFTGGMLAVLGIGMAAGAILKGLRRKPVVLPTRVTVGATESDPWIAASSLPFRHEG